MNRFKILFIILQLSCFSSFAQIILPPENQAPIDGGASLLVGAGVAYGMKKIRDNKKSRKDLKDTI